MFCQKVMRRIRTRYLTLHGFPFHFSKVYLFAPTFDSHSINSQFCDKWNNFVIKSFQESKIFQEYFRHSFILAKVLFTHRCRRQNFRPSLLQQWIENCCCKRLKVAFFQKVRFVFFNLQISKKKYSKKLSWA